MTMGGQPPSSGQGIASGKWSTRRGVSDVLDGRDHGGGEAEGSGRGVGGGQEGKGGDHAALPEAG